MKDYQKAMEVLLSTGTAPSIANKWAKLASTTMDEDLKQIALDLNYLYSRMLKHRSSFYKEGFEPVIAGIKIFDNNDWYKAQNILVPKARQFVENRLAQQKPAWMIMAEKNGWRPPN